MNIALMLAIVVGVCMQDVLRKKLSTRPDNGGGTHEPFNLALAAAALVVHLCAYGASWEGHLPTLGYALAFSVSYIRGRLHIFASGMVVANFLE